MAFNRAIALVLATVWGALGALATAHAAEGLSGVELDPTFRIIRQLDRTYALELTFDVNGERRTFSGVMSSRFLVAERALAKRVAHIDTYVTADAVPIEIPGSPLLVATLLPRDRENSTLGHVLAKACGFPPPAAASTLGTAWLDQVAAATGSCPISDGELPFLVEFSDPTDPQTARNVAYDDVFGPPERPIRFVSARMVLTDAEPTEIIDQILPWLRDPYPPTLRLKPAGPWATRGRSRVDLSFTSFRMRN